MLLPDLQRSVGVCIAWLFVLCWCFLGVALGADTFMASIEVNRRASHARASEGAGVSVVRDASQVAAAHLQMLRPADHGSRGWEAGRVALSGLPGPGPRLRR
jgi:hypothetical protein